MNEAPLCVARATVERPFSASSGTSLRFYAGTRQPTQQTKQEAPPGEVVLTRLRVRLSPIPGLTDIQVSGAPD